MATPKIVFVDTNVFDKNQYYFDSAELKALAENAPKLGISLVLPDPMRREMIRHIQEKAEEAMSMLDHARNKASFVGKIPGFPKREEFVAAQLHLQTGVHLELAKYLESLGVVHLGYDAVDPVEMMDWYDRIRPPFADSKDKRKEFPDAFAVAALLDYAKKQKCQIAVISDDSGMREACELHVQLTYFPSVPTYLDASLSGDAHAATFKAMAGTEAFRPVTDGLGAAFQELPFWHADDSEADIENVVVQGIEVQRVRILNVGAEECVVIVDAKISFTADVTMDDPDTMIHDSSEDFHMALHRLSGEVEDNGELKVAVKCKVDKEWKQIVEVGLVEFFPNYIEVSARPTERDDAYDDDDVERPETEEGD